MIALSTKILPPHLESRIKNENISLTSYNIIDPETIFIEVPEKIKYGIISSKNSIKALLHKKVKIENCFCIGPKTKIALEQNGYFVTNMFENATKLALFIQKNYKNEVFYFFCGTQRRDEIPKSFKNSKNTLFEVICYKNDTILRKFDEKWDFILFFSPNGVKTFFQNNTTNAMLICIGKTTANEAKKYSDKIAIAEETTIESVVEKAIHLFQLK